MDFKIAEKYFKEDKIRELSSTDDGMRFIKLRSLSRKSQLEYLIQKYSIDVTYAKSKDWLKIIYESRISQDCIDETISELYEQDRAVRRKNEDQLINELYKIQSFGWGGLHQNSLEKTIVNNYVKKITSYESLTSAIENEVHNSMRDYVLASWYNHWSSIIIEDIFKDHYNVIPAVGLIKKIDFFVNNKPFDLKVTYLPEGYVKDYRRSHNLSPELTLMKHVSRDLNIAYDRSAPDAVLIPDLWRKLDDNPDEKSSKLISELHESREKLLTQAMQNPELLVRWLYENQGERRFDASNRLFLVLIDKNNFFESWKLKRAKPLIANSINKFLDSLNGEIGFKLDFDWGDDKYTTESDVIFVVK
ncbi:MAG: hypothetical protein METHAR1v1_1010004 [Methanothrix sp.]|jgi:hypothetical protein|nr:MAG: hypothetical protein METHAR1v1_1010004 [Methanothrix sp.]